MGRSVTHLCGARPENCPPGIKTGDPISPPGGHIGRLQIITDVAIDATGNVWVANNWDRPDERFKKVPEPALATRFGGNGTVVFFGLAEPVRTPLIGPPQAPTASLAGRTSSLTGSATSTSAQPASCSPRAAASIKGASCLTGRDVRLLEMRTQAAVHDGKCSQGLARYRRRHTGARPRSR
jgi:hypothetical protein